MLSEIQCYYNTIPADGGCDEGPGYWGRAGASLFEFLYLLKCSTNGALDLFGDEKICMIADYLKKVSNRITLFGAVFLALVALVPSLIFKAVGGANGVVLMNAFSATGLLIVVSVALEFEQALQSQIMMKQYKGILK
jgi:hypothetical protein